MSADYCVINIEWSWILITKYFDKIYVVMFDVVFCEPFCVDPILCVYAFYVNCSIAFFFRGTHSMGAQYVFDYTRVYGIRT